MYHQERALGLNPNNDLIVVQQGELLTWLGRPEEGIDWIRKAMRLNPYHPERFWSHLGRAYFVARRYAEAVEAFARISRPDHTHHAFLAAACAQMGDATAARAHAEEVLQPRSPTSRSRPIWRPCTTSARATASTIAKACSRPACRPDAPDGSAPLVGLGRA